jgi:hypothetical protein
MGRIDLTPECAGFTRDFDFGSVFQWFPVSNHFITARQLWVCKLEGMKLDACKFDGAGKCGREVPSGCRITVLCGSEFVDIS